MISQSIPRNRRPSTATLWLRAAIGVALLITVLTPSFVTAGTSSPSGSARIDPRVYLESSGRLLVTLHSPPGPKTTGASESVARLRSAANVSQPALTARLQALGTTVEPLWIANVLAIRADSRLIALIASWPEVKSIEPDPVIRVPETQPAVSSGTLVGPEWGISRVRAPEVWSTGHAGSGITVGIADTGVYSNHAALRTRYRGWNGQSFDHNYHWWDAFDRTSAPFDDNGHGTHVAGTVVGGEGDNQIGVAPGARWIACRNMRGGFGNVSSYLACLQFFLAPTDLAGNNPDPGKRADIVNNSYACDPAFGEEGCENLDALRTAIENLRAAGVFVASAAGNSGPSCSSIKLAPAVYAASFSAGAVDIGDNVALFSSRGPVTADGSNRLKPNVVAPGVAVRSSTRDGGYGLLSGTSMASPHLAGVVALLWSAFPDLRGKVGQTEQLLQQTAKPLPVGESCGGVPGSAIPNNTTGHGLIDGYAAFQLWLRDHPLPRRLLLPSINFRRGFN